MRILVTFAVDAEFAPWRKLRSFRCLSKSPYEIHDVQIGAHAIRVLLTGIGWECARRTVNPIMNDVFDACISSGLAGGIRDCYRAGDILAFDQVGEVNGERHFPSDAILLGHARKQGAAVAERLITSKRLIVTVQEKQRMGLFGDAVDMESFRVMAAAQGRGIPAVAIRAISDAHDEDLPVDFTNYVSDSGQIAVGKILGKVVFSPQILPSMVRFGSRTKQVAQKLGEFLDSFVLNLAPSMTDLESKVAAQ